MSNLEDLYDLRDMIDRAIAAAHAAEAAQRRATPQQYQQYRSEHTAPQRAAQNATETIHDRMLHEALSDPGLRAWREKQRQRQRQTNAARQDLQDLLDQPMPARRRR